MTIEPTVTPVAATRWEALSDEERSAVAAFCDTAKANGGDPVTAETNPYCGLFLKGEPGERLGYDLPCLAVCKGELGDWAVLYRDPTSGSLVVSQFLDGETA